MDREPVMIDLALQGGGSHGALTWGVLDRILEEPHLAEKMQKFDPGAGWSKEEQGN
jgi:hypothetical protein